MLGEASMISATLTVRSSNGRCSDAHDSLESDSVNEIAPETGATPRRVNRA